MYNFDIGGNEVKPSTSESVDFIPFNRTLLALQLTDEEAVVPEFVEGLKTVEDAFKHFEPSLEVKFTDGTSDKLRFTALSDFSLPSLSTQSQTLRRLTGEYHDYEQIVKSLGENALLQKALSNPDDKATIIATLKALQAELQQADGQPAA